MQKLLQRGWNGQPLAGAQMTIQSGRWLNMASTSVTTVLLEGVDIVLTMEQDQVGIVRRRFPGFKGEVRRLCKGTDVEDPYGYPFSVFKEVCQQIAEGVDDFCQTLQGKASGQ